MALQAGYIAVQTENGEAMGLMTGLGGRLHFNIHDHIRVGGAGAATNLNYDKPGNAGSYFQLSYGGLTLEATFPVNQWRFSLGILAGGGKSVNLDIRSVTNDTILGAIYEKEATFIASPLLTVEYHLTETISFMFLADFLMGNNLAKSTSLKYPKFHLGVLFNK